MCIKGKKKSGHFHRYDTFLRYSNEKCGEMERCIKAQETMDIGKVSGSPSNMKGDFGYE